MATTPASTAKDCTPTDERGSPQRNDHGVSPDEGDERHSCKHRRKVHAATALLCSQVIRTHCDLDHIEALEGRVPLTGHDAC